MVAGVESNSSSRIDEGELELDEASDVLTPPGTSLDASAPSASFAA